MKNIYFHSLVCLEDNKYMLYSKELVLEKFLMQVKTNSPGQPV